MQYTHSVSAAALVVNEKDEVLLIKSPNRGWEYPGGMVEPGEALQEAVIREILEEAGVKAEVIAFAGICKNIENEIVNVDFVCRYVSGELKTSIESIDVKWVKRDKALDMVEYPLTKKRLEYMLSHSKGVYCFGFKKDPFEIIMDERFKV